MLGAVWRWGPLTPYALRKMARESRSPHLSSSAGSVYGLVERLDRSGLIEGEAFTQGEREGVEYRITPEGKRSLRAWIKAPGCATGALTDPVRSRVQIIGALPTRERKPALRRIREELERDLQAVEASRGRAESIDDPHLLSAWRGDLLVQRARLEWVREIEASLG